MKELLRLNQEEARAMLSHCQGFSDEQLKTMLLDAFVAMGMPREFPPDVDTSREGLLDLLAGLTAIACGTPVEQG